METIICCGLSNPVFRLSINIKWTEIFIAAVILSKNWMQIVLYVTSFPSSSMCWPSYVVDTIIKSTHNFKSSNKNLLGRWLLRYFVVYHMHWFIMHTPSMELSMIGWNNNMLLFIFVIACCLFNWRRILGWFFFIVYLYLYCRRRSNY